MGGFKVWKSLGWNRCYAAAQIDENICQILLQLCLHRTEILNCCILNLAASSWWEGFCQVEKDLLLGFWDQQKSLAASELSHSTSHFESRNIILMRGFLSSSKSDLLSGFWDQQNSLAASELLHSALHLESCNIILMRGFLSSSERVLLLDFRDQQKSLAASELSRSASLLESCNIILMKGFSSSSKRDLLLGFKKG